jgi:hypothetical protein
MKQYILNNDEITKLQNENIQFDFPVLYPNDTYFDGVKSVLNSYGMIFEALSDVDYDPQMFMEEMEKSPMVSSYYKEKAFSVRKLETGKDYCVAERLNNSKNDCLMESYVCGEKYEITENVDGNTKFMLATLFIDLGNVKIYFEGSSAFVEDRQDENNIKKYYIYLD